ncbi:putative beta-galactosidase [Oceanicola granulosus HTCC2516]|uniref:Putative beta-galactosidase n=1 Tax=Oceanicola granulosus (strain ATCC BAA-861 / DSM 15982 / KCTC 12143 / HTCC2516) TaxID=314256 RepID=Q2CGR5_OCEGH|nr:hypothetical protein [Oceanicola granulosus]EAR51870.1 putative beta-galactosidase [Oceanicola granulosus HTCC2516]
MLHAFSIAGDWALKLDPDNKGTDARWYRQRLEGDTMALPGSIDAAAKAPASDAATMAHLSRRNPYVGPAWYQREIEIPEDQDGLYHWLVLERPHGEVNLFLDDLKVGRDRSLSTEHRFFLGQVAPGRHVVTMMIDNSRFEAVGEAAQHMGDAFWDVAHSTSDHTQSNWNGTVGYMRIEAAAAAISALRVDAPDRQVRVRAELEAFDPDDRWPTFWAEPHDDRLRLTVELAGGDAPIVQERSLTIGSAWTPVDVPLDLPDDAATWSEFTPVVHRLTVEWLRDGAPLARKETTFGIRDVRCEGRHITLNGRRLYLRGTLDCALFPKTGYPPTDHAEWRRIFTQCRDIGLNHIRFHSWCPPRAAFEVADEMGMLLAVEGPVWPRLYADPNLDDFIHQECERIFRDYGNHPSFVMFAIGNELHGEGLHAFTSRFVARWKAEDGRRVYTGGSGWPSTPEADYLTKPQPRCQRWGDGLDGRLNRAPLETNTDWRDWVESVEQPLLVHETGQWCVYPDLDSIGKFDGPLAARNFEMIKADLDAKGRLDEAPALLETSGLHQVALYKEEIEACLRTRDFAGYQLLGVQDFTGQGTALVGVLDAFWDPKPYLDEAHWREFCAPVVPLWRTDGFVLEAGQPFAGTVEVAQFGADDLPAGALRWQVLDDVGGVCRDGEIAHDGLAAAQLHGLGRLEIDTADLAPDRRYQLVLSLPESDARNRWDFWVMDSGTAELPIVRSLDADVLARVAKGERLVFMPEPGEIEETSVLGWTNVFWNTLWTSGQEPHTLGLRIDTDHPALAGFPARRHNEAHWFELMSRRVAFGHEGLPGRPIVAVNDDWNRNRDLSLLSEVAVGEGRLLISAMDLAAQSDRPVARSLARALARYLDAPATAGTAEPQAVLEWWQANKRKGED